MTEQEIIDSANRILAKAKELLVRDGRVASVAFICRGKNEEAIFDMTFKDEQQKRLNQHVLLQIMRGKDISAVITVDEAWMGMDKPGKPNPTMPSKRKDRQECIVVNALTRSGFRRTYLQPFKRDKNKIIFLEGQVLKDGWSYLDDAWHPRMRSQAVH